jgi:hypothetical protein
VPCLQEKVVEVDASAVLRRNVDFLLTQFRGAPSIQFEAGVGPGDVWQGEDPPGRLWAELTYLDNRPVIEANFGIPAEFTLEDLSQLQSNLDYLSAVRGLWYAHINGPTLGNLRIGCQILLGLPFAEEAGVIEEIRVAYSQRQSRILLRDVANQAIVRAYLYPRGLPLEVNSATGVPYVVGDAVRQLAPLVSGVAVIDYVKDPTWFRWILSQGSMLEVEKFHKFLLRVDSTVFSLKSLAFAMGFVNRVRPKYVLPFVVVRAQIKSSTIETADELSMKGKLILNEGVSFPNMGVAQMFDDYRAAGGGIRNQFDSNNDPDDPPPTFPTPDSDITWAFDKGYLYPADSSYIGGVIHHSGGAAPYDDSRPISPAGFFSDSSVTAVPAGPSGYSLPGSYTATHTSSTGFLRVVVVGSLGASPGDYEFVIDVNGTEVGAAAWDVTQYGAIASLFFVCSVSSGDVVTARIRPASGGSRAPVWTYVAITLVQSPLTFAYNDVLPAGTYYQYAVV